MSESIVRKVQPFTIGTRLSVPAVSKCQDFTANYLQSPSLDNCTLQHSLNSLYLSRAQVRAHGPRLVSPLAQSVSPVAQDDMAAEDHLNQNIVSATAVARSIKKITISGHKDRAENKTACVFVPATTENNNNNNNVSSSTEQILPRIVGVSCENKPNSQFKVLLRKEGNNEQTSAQSKSEVCEDQPIQQISSLEAESQRKEIHPAAETEDLPDVSSQTDGFTQRNSLFSREALQAEAWIQGKLQDLRDGSNIQRCPLQDREQFSQTLQRDLKDFENTLIQLNQMGEQLICKRNPTSDLVKKQLGRLREQWQTLKQTAASQTRAVGGAKHLQEFNAKVEKLEAWIKEKEEQPSLVSVLGESVDKLQLTRRILDLKQDEQLYRSLYDEINHLALKLEKQGKADGKNITSRRKHINKMYTWSFEMNWWLKVQARLKNYHEHLQLALEVSSFYQQADNVLLAIHNMKKDFTASKELDKLGDQELRDIAGQIMMLDVSASQLSNLHPALADGVTQKQSEVKESWALLQKTLKTDRPALPSTSSTLSREEPDPSSREQCIVGTELQRTMGKEVKEEQNRLKGFVGAADFAIIRTSSQTQEQEASSQSSSLEGEEEAAVCTNDVTTRHQAKGERKPRAAASAQPGHPPLHFQLQKFTVSADKTLSWLKENVHMATQVCSVASLEGLDAARRCQQALEQEILNNRDRIEVVKREGRELVRAQHPGGSRIEEFVGQLEVLWEELRRRHQRNAVFLQASEELGFRVVKVLQALGSLDAWLESVELSMKESSLATDPETMSAAERQSCLLERQVTARGPELSALRQEVERLQCHSHPLTRGLPARMDHMETKFQRLQNALTQQSSELQDTRMLAEFLERVELEESQELRGSPFSLGQPLHSEMSSVSPLMDLRDSTDSEPLLQSMGDPVEELREAVEMLNDTVRERGRSQNHDQAVRELLSEHASLAVRVEESLSRSKDLGLDVLEKETDMAVQCEPDRCGLDSLWERQDLLELDCDTIGEQVCTVQRLASRLQELCPERVQVFGAKIQATLQAWSELEASVEQNKSRLREFVQLQDFFRSYLQMISWTEDTRSCIFSDTALHHGKDGKAPMAPELDLQIEQKFEEFEELAATGRNILDKEHHLSQMVRERMEELRSMLGWIAVHWRAQKQQWLHKLEAQDNVYSIMCSSLSKPAACEQLSDQSVYSPILSHDEDLQQQQPPADSESSSKTSKPSSRQTDDEYEVMTSVPPQSPEVKIQESPKSSVFVLKDKGSPGLGNTVNLILSFGNTGDSQVQVLDAPVTEEEPVCRVSTYLHVKDSNLASGPVYESITFPRQKSHSAAATSPNLAAMPPSSLSTPANPSQVGNCSHVPTGGSSSIFSSLKRISKKRKRKRDAQRRHTIQKIMGEEEEEAARNASETIVYDTRTWPLKEARRKKPESQASVSKSYIQNPLLGDIERECTGEYNITPYAVSEGPKQTAGKSHCRFLSLGSVLSFDLPKDMTLIPSIQDIITIAPPETKTPTGADPDPHSQRQSALSSFKQTRPALVSPTVDEIAEKGKSLTSDNSLKPRSPAVFNNEQALEQLSKCSNQQSECTESLNEETDQRNQTKCPNPTVQLPIYVNHLPASACQKHKCLSVHTLIKDLNGHNYHKCVSCHHGRPNQNQNQASHVTVNLKSTVNVSVRQDSVDSGVSSLGSIKLSSDMPCFENPQPKGTVGKMLSLDVECSGSSKSNEKECVHVDHQQFEEVEEELEGIWGQNLRNSICSDIMYQTNPEETLSIGQNAQHVSPSPSPKSPVVQYRHLVTASAPNLLIAEFKLPPSVQSLLGYDRKLAPFAVGERRSWAAFPSSASSSTSGTSVAVNETASDPIQLPHIEDGQKYIYQYREEEEEEAQKEEHSGPSKDTSLCLFSPHVEDEDHSQQHPRVTTGGHCIALRAELQTMEGALERKQRLQLGGKKATSRGWSAYHAVLHKHTLCFYQDRKDTLRSSICGLPLNLTGAECVPAPDYNKKPNCFQLRLRDGSEYLLNASSRLMMKKWIMKIQTNTGRPTAVNTGIYRDPEFPFSVNSPESCVCPAPDTRSSHHDITSTFPQLKPRGSAHKPSIALREATHMSQEQDSTIKARVTGDNCSDEDDSSSLTQIVTQMSRSPTDSAPLSGQRRSHSFTSATYQKIGPVSGRGADRGPNYCVTLLVGDQSRDVPTISHTQPPQLPLLDVSAHRGLSSYTSLPRPRNKSVFKKFFGRKEY